MVSHEWHTEYAGYTIKPPVGDDGQWFIIKNGANVMPGAARLETEVDAFMAIDVLEAIGGDGRRFWHLWRAVRGVEGRPSHDHSAQPQASPQRPEVTLGYSPSKNSYYVAEISGRTPAIPIPAAMNAGSRIALATVVRVGDWLDELQTYRLGSHAELTIKRYGTGQR